MDTRLPDIALHELPEAGRPDIGGSGQEALPDLGWSGLLAVGNGPATRSNGVGEEDLPNLDVLVGAGNVGTANLPNLDWRPSPNAGGGQLVNNGVSVAGSGQWEPLTQDSVMAWSSSAADQLPVVDALPDFGGPGQIFDMAAVGAFAGATLGASDDLPLLPGLSANIGNHAAGSGKHRLRVFTKQQDGQNLASPELHWRSLPYLRTSAFSDIPAIAQLYGADLAGTCPDPQWLDAHEARSFLANLPQTYWWHLDAKGELKTFCLERAVDFLEIFSGCGHLTLGAAQSGLRVGPSIDKCPGAGHPDTFAVDIRQAHDRRIVWALVCLLMPLWIHVGFPCTFWVAIAHWTRRRDLDRNERARKEALVFIIFARQIVLYQASRRRHSSIENPPRSVSWDLDIVKDMIREASMALVEMDLCTWGATDPGSGLHYHKTMRFACTFDMKPLARRCPTNHEHEAIKGVVSQGPLKGRSRSSLSGRYPLPLCIAWASLAKSSIIAT